jgi:hypothetical protein
MLLGGASCRPEIVSQSFDRDNGREVERTTLKGLGYQVNTGTVQISTDKEVIAAAERLGGMAARLSVDKAFEFATKSLEKPVIVEEPKPPG